MTKESTLSIFANFRIDDEERYLRMKDSFMSFKDICAEKWVINVRGSYKLKTIFFLREHLGEKLYPYLLESKKGWFFNTRNMLGQIDTDFVLFWIEDHINMVDLVKYEEILNEMKDNECDSLIYSTCCLKRFELIKPIADTKNMNLYRLDTQNVSKMEDYAGMFYILSAVSILRTVFFKKVINSNHPVLKRWPKDAPFDFEKRSTDIQFLPIRHAVPKFELFASIDCDHGALCLQSRGLYPKRVTRNEEIERKSRKHPDYFVLKMSKAIIPLPIKKLIKRIKYTLF